MDITGTPTELTVHGIGVSSGLVTGTAFCAGHWEPPTSFRSITAGDIPKELASLHSALDKSRTQLRSIQGNVEQNLGGDHGNLFDSYLLILDDPMFIDRIEMTMRAELICVEEACTRVVEQIAGELGRLKDDYLRERVRDFQDVGERLVRNLMGVETDLDLTNIPEGCILVADELTPSETARLDSRKVRAFVTATGSRTCHTAILARALGIPAVVAAGDGFEKIETGTELALNGDTGVIVLNPNWNTRHVFMVKAKAEADLQTQLLAESQKPVETLDGYQACLVANVALPSEAQSVRQKYNVGIGLFRTEFLFINGMSLQDEEAQFQAYKATVEAVKPYSVIFRTLDIGGDKFLSQFEMPHELNPFMGMRAIRFSLSHPDIFKTQLRAILRASAFGKVRVMFPMISTYDELESTLKLLDEVKLELTRQHVPFNENLDVGCMIEVPSAVMLASHLVRHLTFFSLGTNDLVQYSMAADRLNPSIGHLYQPVNPAIIQMMKNVVDVARDNGRWISVCGEIAGDCLYTPLILGMGIHELSMSPMALTRVHRVIRSIRMHEAEALVNYALGCDRYSDVLLACKCLVGKTCPEFVDGPPLAL